MSKDNYLAMVKLKPDSTVDRMVEGLTVYKVKCVELPITAQGEMICILVHTDISDRKSVV